jgi:hypothetical protein
LLTLRNLVLTTVVTVLVTSGVTTGVRTLSDRLADEPTPVEVRVIRDPNDVPAFGPPIDVVLPASASTEGSPGKACEGFHDWALSKGAADSGKTRLQVIVRGADEGEVVVNGMRVEIVERRRPLRGVQLSCPTAGTLAERRVSIDLDDVTPEAVYRSTTGRSFGFTVAEGEVESFLVTAETSSHFVRWRLLLDLVVGQQHRVLPVLADQETFATSARVRGAVWEWDFEDTWTSPGHAPIPAGEPLPALGAGP